jgi:SAM-dependent methyltransferase
VRTDWDDRYAAPGFAYGTEPNAFLVESVRRLRPAGLALSLGEGEGRNAVFLARAGWRVIGVDRSRVGLRKALALARDRHVPLAACVADLAAFPLPRARFDLVVSVFCHLPASVRHALHRSVVRALRPGGAVVYEAFTPRQLAFGTGGPSRPELLVTLDALRKEFAGLRFLVGRECEREVGEGRLHRGVGAVVQVVAVRPPAAS